MIEAAVEIPAAHASDGLLKDIAVHVDGE